MCLIHKNVADIHWTKLALSKNWINCVKCVACWIYLSITNSFLPWILFYENLLRYVKLAVI
jgi:hypothetical protein